MLESKTPQPSIPLCSTSYRIGVVEGAFMVKVYISRISLVLYIEDCKFCNRKLDKNIVAYSKIHYPYLVKDL